MAFALFSYHISGAGNNFQLVLTHISNVGGINWKCGWSPIGIVGGINWKCGWETIGIMLRIVNSCTFTHQLLRSYTMFFYVFLCIIVAEIVGGR